MSLDIPPLKRELQEQARALRSQMREPPMAGRSLARKVFYGLCAVLVLMTTVAVLSSSALRERLRARMELLWAAGRTPSPAFVTHQRPRSLPVSEEKALTEVFGPAQRQELSTVVVRQGAPGDLEAHRPDQRESLRPLGKELVPRSAEEGKKSYEAVLEKVPKMAEMIQNKNPRYLFQQWELLKTEGEEQWIDMVFQDRELGSDAHFVWRVNVSKGVVQPLSQLARSL